MRVGGRSVNHFAIAFGVGKAYHIQKKKSSSMRSLRYTPQHQRSLNGAFLLFDFELGLPLQSCCSGLLRRQAVNGAGKSQQSPAVKDEIDTDGHADKVGAG
jgi:hypothetical protein